MIVTSTEFKTNLGKYLDLINREEVIITRNGRKIAKLVREEDDALSSLRSLRGIIADPELSQATDTQIRDIIAQER
ncbi:MAG: type II toxin-antitoxin system Phd/YefM family antitoxin, partial [Clostridiales bacterium]|nr:type II toxin-antitoxin system Phd/YefM family antitoxin [Clostridiales bacterium]